MLAQDLPKCVENMSRCTYKLSKREVAKLLHQRWTGYALRSSIVAATFKHQRTEASTNNQETLEVSHVLCNSDCLSSSFYTMPKTCRAIMSEIVIHASYEQAFSILRRALHRTIRTLHPPANRKVSPDPEQPKSFSTRRGRKYTYDLPLACNSKLSLASA